MSFEYWQFNWICHLKINICDKFGRTLHPLTHHIPPTAVLFSTVEETNVSAACHTSCFWPEFYLQLVFSATNSFLFLHEAKA